jgi:hypothetical protein
MTFGGSPRRRQPKVTLASFAGLDEPVTTGDTGPVAADTSPRGLSQSPHQRIGWLGAAATDWGRLACLGRAAAERRGAHGGRRRASGGRRQGCAVAVPRQPVRVSRCG